MSHGQHLSAEEVLEHGHLPDPEAQAIKCLGDKIRDLEQKIEALSKGRQLPELQVVPGEQEETSCGVDLGTTQEEG